MGKTNGDKEKLQTKKGCSSRTSVVQVCVLQLLNAAVHVDVAVYQQHNLVFQEFVRIHESVLIAKPLAAHVLHDLVPAPKTLEIVRFFGDEVDVADERVADVEEEAGLNLLLAGGAAVFVKLGGGMGGWRKGCNTEIEVHLSDDMELVRVQEGSAGAIPLLEGFDTLLREV